MNESIVFVIRIWTGASFRAVVRQVDEEQTRLFETPASLAHFFAEKGSGLASCARGKT